VTAESTQSVKRKLVLNFPHALVDQPIMYRLVKDHDVIINILKARVTPKEEGQLVVELTGPAKNLKAAMGYLKDIGVSVQPLAQDIRVDEKKCTHCTACVPLCPTDAITVDEKTLLVCFDKDRCIACEMCVQACPVNAVEILF